MIVENNQVYGIAVPVPVSTPVTIPANADNDGNLFWTHKSLRVSIQIVAYGNVNGSFKLQWSNDQSNGQSAGSPTNPFVPTNWTLLGAAVPVNVPGPGNTIFTIPYQEICYEYLQLLFQDASAGTATGAIQARIKFQGL